MDHIFDRLYAQWTIHSTGYMLDRQLYGLAAILITSILRSVAMRIVPAGEVVEKGPPKKERQVGKDVWKRGRVQEIRWAGKGGY